jgi:hypothetical protein
MSAMGLLLGDANRMSLSDIAKTKQFRAGISKKIEIENCREVK